MLGNKNNKESSERDYQRMKQEALQTKTQKRWRAKGSHLNAIIAECATAAAQEWETEDVV